MAEDPRRPVAAVSDRERISSIPGLTVESVRDYMATLSNEDRATLLVAAIYASSRKNRK